MKAEITVDELIDILRLLSALDGFILGRNGAQQLPEYVANKISKVSEMLANKIKESK